MLLKEKIILFILLGSTSVLLAQQNIFLKDKIQESILNENTGIVLVKTSRAVIGIDPETQKVIWENERMRKLDFNRYSEIPFTPYVFFEDKPFFNSKFISKTLNTRGVSRAIVDVSTGKILFNSIMQGYQAVFNTLILPEQKAVLVDGKIEEGFGIGLFDFESGHKIWMTNVSADFFTTAKGAILNEEKVLLDENQNIFWLKNRRLLKIDPKTGNIIYDKKGITSILINEDGNRLYISSNNLNGKKLDQETAIYAVDPKSMDSLWLEPAIKVVGNIVETTLDKDQLVVITSKGFNIIIADSGKKKWRRSAPLPLIRKVVPTGDNYLVVQENKLTRINQFGHNAWRSPLKITYSNNEDPIHILDDEPYALFITPSRANRIQIETGNRIWKEDVTLFDADYLNRNLKLKIPHHRVWFNPDTKQFPVYNDNNFYLFNNSDSVAPPSLYTFNFGRKFPELKIRDKGYLFNESNNYYLFNFMGKLVYKKEYPAMKSGSFVRRSFRNSFHWLRRGLQITSATFLFAPTQANRAIRSAVVSNNFGGFGSTVSSIYGTYHSYTRGLSAITNIKVDIGSNLEYIFKRMNKSRNNDDYMIIAVPREDKIQIINFQIDTGVEEVLKEMDNRGGKFIIDEIERVLYFFKGKKISIEAL